jgi:hypothetical protein
VLVAMKLFCTERFSPIQRATPTSALLWFWFAQAELSDTLWEQA